MYRDQFLSGIVGKPPISLSAGAAAGSAQFFLDGTPHLCLGPSLLSGVCAADVYKDALVITGPGVFNFLSLFEAAGGVAAYTVTTNIYIDGVLVLTNTFATGNSPGRGRVLIGAANGTTAEPTGVVFDQVPFASSFRLEFKGSIAATDKLGFRPKYRIVS